MWTRSDRAPDPRSLRLSRPLPRRAGRAAAHPERAGPPDRGRGRERVDARCGRVLIARQPLEAYGYRVLCPDGPDELRRILSEQGPQIAAAVVNVSMPDVDAF